MRSTACANLLATERNQWLAQVHHRPPDCLLSLQGLLLRLPPHLLTQRNGKHGPLLAGIGTGLLGQIGGHGRLPLFALFGAGRFAPSSHPCLTFRLYWFFAVSSALTLDSRRKSIGTHTSMMDGHFREVAIRDQSKCLVKVISLFLPAIPLMEITRFH